MSGRTALVIAGVAVVLLAVIGGLAWLVIQPAATPVGPGTDTGADTDSAGSDDPSSRDADTPKPGPGNGQAPDALAGGSDTVKPRPLPKPKGPDEIDAAPRILVKGYERGLNWVDWSVVGPRYVSLVRGAHAMGVAVSRGDEIPQKTAEKVGADQGAIHEQVAEVTDEFPGTEGWGPVTHPVFAANSLAAALESAGLPLSDEQTGDLTELTTRFAQEDRRRLDAYGADELHLLKSLEEVELRGRFVREVRALLTREQARATGAHEYRDRVALDPFSPAYTWEPWLEVQWYAGEAHDHIPICEWLRMSFGIEEDDREALQEVVRASLERLPADVRGIRMGRLDRHNFFRVDVANSAAAWTLGVIRELRARLDMDAGPLFGTRTHLQPLVLVPPE